LLVSARDSLGSEWRLLVSEQRPLVRERPPLASESRLDLSHCAKDDSGAGYNRFFARGKGPKSEQMCGFAPEFVGNAK
jgi:hypothetical protein